MDDLTANWNCFHVSQPSEMSKIEANPVIKLKNVHAAVVTTHDSKSQMSNKQWLPF